MHNCGHSKRQHVCSCSFSLRIYHNEEEGDFYFDAIPLVGQQASTHDKEEAQCSLQLRIKHPLFKAQKIGLVAGIQYQGE